MLGATHPGSEPSAVNQTCKVKGFDCMIVRISPLHVFPIRWRGTFAAGFLVILLAVPLFVKSATGATTPKLLGVSLSDKQESAADIKAMSPEQQRKMAKQALVEAEAERDRTFVGPAGFSHQDLKEKYRLLDGLVTRLNSRINLIDELEELQRTRAAAEKNAKSWAGFTMPPPYSILMVDEITGTVMAARDKVLGLTTNRELLDRQVEQYQEAAKQTREIERQAGDELEQAQSSEERLTASWNKELARIRAVNADLMSILISLRSEVMNERLGVATVELEFMERQLEEARKRMVFSQADLNKALALLKSTRSTLEQELELALARDAGSRKRSLHSRQELDSFTLRHSKTDNAANTVRHRAELEARQRAAVAWVDSSRFEVEVVSSLITINKSNATFWERRYAAITETGAKKRHSINIELNTSRERLKSWIELAKHKLEMSQAAEREQETRLARMTAHDPIRAAESDLLAARKLQRELAERQKDAVEQADRELQSWQEDIDRRLHSRSVATRSKEWLGTFPAMLRNVWRFELFAIEDSVEVAGQKVVTSRGVTVGKSIGAILLFLVGYFIAAFLGQRAQRIMISRFRVTAHQANVIRRWLMALTVFILLIITLNLARIPLTVFAFLGGALAIGVGFGTQTLIKNFISGILILLERNVKVGDTIDVDGVVGRIVTVDIRASTILGFDGVETVIPNSTFLDNKVTNWTHTNARLRRIVRVGVAYGSQTAQVRDILAECGSAHDLILKDPLPEALFEDFGDSSLIFALYFWIEHGPETNPLKVASDLRFMIYKRFAEENIVFAFPQVDVHLDSSQPLPRETMPSRSE